MPVRRFNKMIHNKNPYIIFLSNLLKARASQQDCQNRNIREQQITVSIIKVQQQNALKVLNLISIKFIKFYFIPDSILNICIIYINYYITLYFIIEIMLRLFIVLIYTSHQTLIYQFNASSNLRDGWEDLGGNAIITSCGGIQYFGSSNYGGTVVVSKIFDVLEDHSHIRVDCVILKIDQDSSTPVFQLDYKGRPVFESSISSQNQICGYSQQEYIQTISLTIQHNRRTFWMFVNTFNGSGLISLSLNTIKCQYDCDGCIENYQIFCLKWKLHQYSFIQKSLTSFDGWTFGPSYQNDYYCGQCQLLKYQEIQYSTELPPHSDLLIRFVKADDKTIIVDYLYGKTTLNSYYQPVELLIENHYDPILFLNFKTSPSSDYSFIRDFEIFYTLQEKITVNKLNEGCLEQIEDKCLICLEGWIYNQYLKKCHPVYEDQYSSQGLFQSESQIIVSKFNEGCLEQIDNICLICQIGWIQDQFHEKCQPIYEDQYTYIGVVQTQSEIVSKFNEGCLEQIDNMCLVCQVGWIQDQFHEKCHLIYEDQYSYIGVVQTQTEILVSRFNEGCLEQIDNICLICQAGWIQDQFLENCHIIYEDQSSSVGAFQLKSEVILSRFNEGCLEQVDNICLICQKGWIQDQFHENCHSVYADENQYSSLVLFQLQSELIVSEFNEGCLEQINNICLICQKGWIQDQFHESCHPVYADEDQYSSLGLFQIQQKIIVNKFNEGCLEQIDDICLNCEIGWIQDQFLENCHSICGDGIIQGQEECDDANQISNDSCYQCKYSCLNFCKTCEFGICLKCIFGFHLNSDFNCVPLCGDSNVVPYSAEQCDLTDNGEWDNCQDCRFILIANCKNQLLSMCLVCEIGYSLIENACFPICGDKFILQQYEECDDGNIQPYDGCFECKFQCSEDCKNCHQGQCILQCEDGYQIVNSRCLSVCGDQIVTKEEDCDDGNTIQFDGCFNCKYSYSCPENCSECYQGTCLVCYDQYKLLNSNQCQFQLNCGDGLLQKQEECDDGNYEEADGCKDCMIEQNWICTTMIRDSPSQCILVKAPKLVITYLNMTFNKQYISIQFNQQVKIYTNQPLSKTINFKLSNVDMKDWNNSLYIHQDVGSYVSFGEYVAEIEVHQLLEFRPILTILVNQTVANIDNAVLDDFKKSITLQYPKYLDETQKEYSYRLRSLNIYLIYGLSGITCLNLLLGSGDLFIEILAILQSQQYLRYINLQFPENLEIYFTLNDLITIQPLLDFINFSYIFQFIEVQQNQQPYSEGKFDVYKYNSSLIINLSCQILQCFIILFLILLYQLIKKVIYKQIFCSRNFYYASSLSLYISPKLILKCEETFYNICKDLLNLKKFLSFQGLQKAVILNGWDMAFKILLYTRNIQTNNYLDIVQLILASIILILYFTIFIDCFKLKQKLQKRERFAILSFGRQFFFQFFLINVQSSQILQLGLLFFTNVLQIKFLFIYRHIQSKKNYIVQMVVEISVMIFMLSSYLYISECKEYFNEEKKIILGWIHIVILSSGVNVQLIFIIKDIYQTWKKLYKRKKPQCARNQLFI
ncbi:unnamed protein product [Paramecium octaurelia]|uniref:Uncharacterized protein n=1 Tax=Paramecium octaurelia TaxID=43137 RepID=A0A8S1VVU6_PAROT|nr:unnamed protein product [Paramecium octaurelia]